MNTSFHVQQNVVFIFICPFFLFHHHHHFYFVVFYEVERARSTVYEDS